MNIHYPMFHVHVLFIASGNFVPGGGDCSYSNKRQKNPGDEKRLTLVCLAGGGENQSEPFIVFCPVHRMLLVFRNPKKSLIG